MNLIDRGLHAKQLLLLIMAPALLAACGAPAADTGSLSFWANGETFARESFISKDGWTIDLDHVLVTVDAIEAHQTQPAYDARLGGAIAALSSAALDGQVTADLAQPTSANGAVSLGTVEQVPAGHYNALSWHMVPGESGYPLVLEGTAAKDGQTIDFTLQAETPFNYSCGSYVGDERKGFVPADGEAEMEMTFHLDHIFGTADLPADDDLNLGAVGFAPLAAVATGGELLADLSELRQMLPPDEFGKLEVALSSLGHVGEGHCFSVIGSEVDNDS